MPGHEFVRVGVGVPELRLADPASNAAATLKLLAEAAGQGVRLTAFPELGLTGYTCGDLFLDRTLQRAALDALVWLAAKSATVYEGLYFVGLPLALDGRLFNCAAAISGGRVVGVVPKSYLPNYKEFYEARHFAVASETVRNTITIDGHEVPFGADLLFQASAWPECVVGVEVCEDLWVPTPPSGFLSLAGAVVIFNLSGSNEAVGKAGYRRQLVRGQSARCLCAYAYAGSGTGESTTDLVFGGHCLIAEDGVVLAESARFLRAAHLTIADVDIGRLQRERQVTTSFGAARGVPSYRRVAFDLGEVAAPAELKRPSDPHPFVPSDPATLAERCDEIFNIQTAALARRLDHAGRPAVAVGVSGGLDSTLALLVLAKTLDLLGVARDTVRALTMPGFGTGARTLANARGLAAALGMSLKEIDIRAACLDQMRMIGHAPFGLDVRDLTPENFAARLQGVPAERRQDLVFENVQARLRTSLLMNSGFVLGTGDLSELALGWCTYNADQMSMYNVNAGVPKTLVKFLVRRAAETEFSGAARATLLDIVATEISPELLPAGAGGEVQSTESAVGPYELHDFFLYHAVRFGAPPGKIVYLAMQARFDRTYTPEVIKKWLAVFYRRLFANQFKRSAMPDGPKVGSVSLSPRGDWRMPSDAVAAAWLAAIE